MTEVVVFDTDVVLIDFGAHHRAAWQALLEELGEEPAHLELGRLTVGRPREARPFSLTAASRTTAHD